MEENEKSDESYLEIQAQAEKLRVYCLNIYQEELAACLENDEQLRKFISNPGVNGY